MNMPFVPKNTMLVFLISVMVTGCINSSNLTSNYNDDLVPDVNWSLIGSIDINQINSDLVNGKPTVDIGTVSYTHLTLPTILLV